MPSCPSSGRGRGLGQATAKEWRRPGPSPLHAKNYTRGNKKPNIRILQEAEIHERGEIGEEKKDMEVPTMDGPSGTNSYLVTGLGWKGGANGCGTWQ